MGLPKLMLRYWAIKTISWILALQNFEKAGVRVYWIPVREFALNREQVAKILKNVAGQFIGKYLPAEQLAEITGLSIDEVVAQVLDFAKVKLV